MIWRWIPASALAARTARACRWGSANRPCGWTALLSEEPADEHRSPVRSREGARLATQGRATRGDGAGRLSSKRCDPRAVLRAVRLDGADAADRRRAIGLEISLRMRHRLAADTDQPAGNRARVRRTAPP